METPNYSDVQGNQEKLESLLDETSKLVSHLKNQHDENRKTLSRSYGLLRESFGQFFLHFVAISIRPILAVIPLAHVLVLINLIIAFLFIAIGLLLKTLHDALGISIAVATIWVVFSVMTTASLIYSIRYSKAGDNVSLSSLRKKYLAYWKYLADQIKHERNSLGAVKNRLRASLKRSKALQAAIAKHYAEQLRNSNLENKHSALVGKQLRFGNWRYLSGTDWENFLKQVFEFHGCRVTTTPVVGDQGVDLLVSFNGQLIAVQAKGYAGSVGNKAVQEVVAGMRHYQATCCAVICNSYFTKSAIELAHSNGCLLIDADSMAVLIKNGPGRLFVF